MSDPGQLLMGKAGERKSCYRTELRSAQLAPAKPIYWVVVKESTVFIAGHQARRMGG